MSEEPLYLVVGCSATCEVVASEDDATVHVSSSSVLLSSLELSDTNVYEP